MYTQNYKNKLHATGLRLLTSYPSENILKSLKNNNFSPILKVVAVKVLSDRGVDLNGIKIRKRFTRVKFFPMNEENPKVKEILNSDLSKVEKVKALFEKGYNAIQISRSSLNTHTSFVYKMKNKLKN